MPSSVPSTHKHLKFRHHIAKEGFPSSLQLVYCSNTHKFIGREQNFIWWEKNDDPLECFFLFPFVNPQNNFSFIIPLEKKILRWQRGDVEKMMCVFFQESMLKVLITLYFELINHAIIYIWCPQSFNFYNDPLAVILGIYNRVTI